MLKHFAHRIFQTKKRAEIERAKAMDSAKQSNAERAKRADPLDPFGQLAKAEESFGGEPNYIKTTASDFPLWELMKADDDAIAIPVPINRAAMDAATPKKVGMDSYTGLSDSGPGLAGIGTLGSQVANPALLGWYASHTFIGWQACAIIAQHWLVDKACTMAGDDACRNGWKLKTRSGDDLTDDQSEQLRALDIEFKVMENLSEFNRFKNIFGIRVAIFEVESDDARYYEKPFNIDGVTEGSYKGISQVDPYWMMPMLTTESTADPSSMHFYDPEYWIISGRKYHRSHLIISRGPQPADILKPTYVFGGIPLTQRIYERVYAAERTANEAPMLAMNKRTTAIHVDLESLATSQADFETRLSKWVHYRDNHAVKVLGTEESMEQFDTSLADFDSVTMNQYQLVAAIASTPATELLGTSPKGFNATGEFEMKSYNKHLVSIQSHVYSPFLDRHYMLLAKSNNIQIELTVIWNSTDTPTEKELSELNGKKAETAERLVNVGAVSPDEVRNNLKDDDHSGYNRLTEDDANEEPGMSPENIAKFQEGAAKEAQGNAQTVVAGAKAQSVGSDPASAAGTAGAALGNEAEGDVRPPGEAPAPTRTGPVAPLKEPGINAPKQGEVARAVATLASDPAISKGLAGILSLLGKLDDAFTPEGVDPLADAASKTPGSIRRSVHPSVRNMNDITPATDPHKLPKMKIAGLTCAIENPRGSVRRGSTLDGNVWEAKMPHHYGFIKGITGADGDELDCFIGPNAKAGKVFVANQMDVNTGEFDEHKCLIGFDDADSALQGYNGSFSNDWKGLDSMWELSVEDFKNWIASGSCSSPLNEKCIGATKSFPLTDKE